MANTKYNEHQKTVGKQTAKLFMGLHDRSLSTFTLGIVQKITGLRTDLASSLIKKAVRRGRVTRLKRGLFVLVPPELGTTSEYAEKPYLVGRHLVGDAPYFLSNASAMEMHRMVTQPQFVVYVSSSKRILNRVIHGTEYHFVFTKSQYFFGTAKHWITKQETVEIGNLERTVIDGLMRPEYCGGIADVAKGL